VASMVYIKVITPNIRIMTPGAKPLFIEDIMIGLVGLYLKYNIITDTHILGEDELNTPRGRQPVYINAINQGYRA